MVRHFPMGERGGGKRVVFPYKMKGVQKKGSKQSEKKNAQGFFKRK